MTDLSQARPGNRNAAGPHLGRAARELATEAREWTGRRHWAATADGPSLSGLYVAVTDEGASAPFGVYRLADTPPRRPVSVAASAEHAKRYVEHVHNFGRPPA